MKEASINPGSYKVNTNEVKRGEEINNSRDLKILVPRRDVIFNSSIYKKIEVPRTDETINSSM